MWYLGIHYPEMDMISFGPTIRYPHSPDEKVNIPSVKSLGTLLATLTNILKTIESGDFRHLFIFLS